MGTAPKRARSRKSASSAPQRPSSAAGTGIPLFGPQYEAVLRDAEHRSSQIIENAEDVIYVHDLDGNFLAINSAAEKLGGYTREELLSMNTSEVLTPEHHKLMRRKIRAQIQDPSVKKPYQVNIVTRKGAEHTLEIKTRPIFENGKAVAVQGIGRDITERKRAEQLQDALYRISTCSHEARELQPLFRTVHKIMSELMYAENFHIALLDASGESLQFPYYVNTRHPQAPTKLLGRGLTEYVMRTGEPLWANLEKATLLLNSGQIEALDPALADWMGAPLKSGGDVFGALVVKSYDRHCHYSEKDREVLTFVSQHIGSAIERSRKEEALRESESRYRSLVQSAVYGIYRSSIEDCFLDVNPAMVTMLGYDSAAELLKISLARDLYADAEQRMRLIAEYAMNESVQNIEVQWKRKDGRVITVRLSGRPVRDAEDNIFGFEMIAEDITERRALEDQLRQSQKMEAVGRLAGGVAHDFNNLLTVIRGYSELMLEELREADPLRAEVTEIKKAADRAASLTRQLLAFSRQQVLAPKVLDLNSVVHNMDQLLRRLLGEDIHLVTILDSGLGRTKADPGQIEQVLMNLALNARDAMPRGGKLTIETMNVDLDENYCREHVAVTPGPYVMFAVSDTGSGMSEKVRSRIFEPFFTTKEVGKGTGLGLSTVYGIIKQSEGYVWVYSEIGIGSTFKIYLPRVDAPADITFSPNGVPTYRGTETILLVEDEDGVRALVRQVLNKYGYKVLEARSGAEAILLHENAVGPIHLLLTDVVLEQMGGRQLAEHLLKNNADMRVLYISGYADDAIVQHGVLAADTEFLQKPFTTEALAQKVRQVLDSKPAAQASR